MSHPSADETPSAGPEERSRRLSREDQELWEAVLQTGVRTQQVVPGQESLLKLDDQYAGLQTGSIRLEVAKSLADPRPYDLEHMDLSRYKALAPFWHDWRRVVGICRPLGLLLSQHLLAEGEE